jgi:acetyltransferase-like isoleucine patch superfamily enzyme
MAGVAVLGAGPHGHQIAALFGDCAELFDDRLEGFRPLDAAVGLPYVVGAAWPMVRRGIAKRHNGVPWEDGNVLFPGARLGYDVVLGRHVHVGFNSVVAHGVVLSDFVTVCPGAVISGEARVCEGVFIGAGAVVSHGGIRIGCDAVIGAGAVVIRDVPDDAVVVGNPARRLR